MSTNVVGVKLQSSGWCGSNSRSSGGLTVSKALGTPAPAASARARSTAKNAGVVGVERIAVRVRDDRVRRKLPNTVGNGDEALAVDLERIVAEVEAVELGADGGGRALGLSVPDLLHPLHGLVRLLPELTRLASLAVREREHARCPALRRRDGDGASGAPHEVGAVCADDEEASTHRLRVAASV